MDTGTHAAVDAVFADYDRTSAPGCAVGIVEAGRLRYGRGYGMGSLEHRVPLGTSSVFYLASVSKQFAAAAVVIAEHEGLLSMDDDVRAHIPEFPDYGTPITIRHLVHHTSGLRDYLQLLSMSGRRPEDVLTDEDMLGLIMRQRALNFEPGSEYLYSNTGYVLLAEIIHRASGQSLREYAEEKIFEPLGMNSTHFHDDRTHVVPNRVFSYARQDEGPWRFSYLMNFDKVGDGGLYSTIEDLARWDGAFYDDLLGVPDFAEKMYMRGVLNSGDTIRYARGLGVNPRRGLQRIVHGGSLMDFRTNIARYPDQRTTFIVLCNRNVNAGALSNAVEDIVLADDFSEPPAVPQAPSQGNREAAEAPEPPHSVPAPLLQELAGDYYSEELDATWTFEVVDGALHLVSPTGDTVPLRAREDLVFEAPAGELVFEREGGRILSVTANAGRVQGLLLERIGPNPRP